MPDLKFTVTKAFFREKTWVFNLPAGWTCPGALKCLARASRYTGEITKGPEQEFPCYAATAERFPAVRERAWANYESLIRLANTAAMAEGLMQALPDKAHRVRIHVGGDFFSQAYFDAWLGVADNFPEVRFWAFTKMPQFWIARRHRIPPNLCLQASVGGKHDHLIWEHGLKYAQVYPSWEEALESGLPVDTDDSHAETGDKPFALVLRSKARRGLCKK